MFHRYSALLLAIGLLLAACGAAAAEPSGDSSADKTADNTAAAETPPAAEADPPKPKPEQVSYEYVLGVLRALTEGSERRYAAMEDQIARLKTQIDDLNRAAESTAGKENAKPPPGTSKVPPVAPTVKPDGKGAAVTPPTSARSPAAKPPAWVGIGLQQVGKDYRVSAQIGPYSRPTELEEEWPVAMQGAVDCYARRQFGPRAVGQVRLSEAELRGLVRETWETTGDFAAGPMKTQHLLVVFEPAMQTRIRTLWEGSLITRRLEYAATGLTSGLLLLGVLFACLKLDHSTAGAYRIRLALAGVFLTGALTAGTIAAVQLVGAPTDAAAAETDAAAARTVSMTLSEDEGDPATARQATVAAGATSLWLWLGAAVGLLGVLLLFSVGKKPAVPDALKETALHEAATRYEPVRHSSVLVWIGLLLVVLVLLLVSVFLFWGTAKVQPEPSSPPPSIDRSVPVTRPAPDDGRPQGFTEVY